MDHLGEWAAFMTRWRLAETAAGGISVRYAANVTEERTFALL